MMIVPLLQLPAQSFAVTLAQQAVSLSLYTLEGAYGSNIYMDVTLSGTVIKTGVKCQNLCRILADCQYTPFVGDFAFFDTQGTNDPDYTGLGTRYVLVYLEGADLAALAA